MSGSGDLLCVAHRINSKIGNLGYMARHHGAQWSRTVAATGPEGQFPDLKGTGSGSDKGPRLPASAAGFSASPSSR